MAAGVDTTTLTTIWAINSVAKGLVPAPKDPQEGFTQTDLDVVHRLASAVPLALPHRARYDHTLQGDLVPRDTVVFFNIYAGHQHQLRAKKASVNGKPSGCPFAANAKTVSAADRPMPFSLGAFTFHVTNNH